MNAINADGSAPPSPDAPPIRVDIITVSTLLVFRDTETRPGHTTSRSTVQESRE